MTRTPWYLSLLFSLVFVAAPAMVMYWFILPGWGDNKFSDYEYWFYWVIGLAFIAYVAVISTIFILFKIVHIDCLNIDIPMAFSFMVILVSCPLGDDLWWARLLMMIGTMLLALPVNMWTTRIFERKANEVREKNKKLRGK